MVILLDAMGGDNAPDATIKGAVKAIDQIKAKLMLIGNEDIIKSKIQLSRCRQEILFSSIRTRKYCILRMKPIRGSMHGLVLPEVTPP